MNTAITRNRTLRMTLTAMLTAMMVCYPLKLRALFLRVIYQ